MSNVKELSEVVSFVCALANGIAESAKDGAITLGDASYLFPLILKLPSAVGGFDKIPDEVKDLDDSEIEQIKNLVKDELDLPNDVIEASIENSIEVAVQLYSLVKKLHG